MNDGWILFRFALFFLVIVLLVAAASAYVHRRASASFALGLRARRALALFLAFGGALMFSARFFGRAFPSLARSIPDTALSPVAVSGATVVVAVMISAAALGLVDLAHALASLLRRVRAPAPLPALDALDALPVALPQTQLAEPDAAAPHLASLPAPEEVGSSLLLAPPGSAAGEPFSFDRRSFLAQATTGSALLLGGSSSLYGALIGRHDYQLVEVAIPIPGLPRRLDGYTLVQLSDLHLGLFVGEPEMAAALELVRRARPDRLVLTGDLVDHDPRYAETLGRFLRSLSASCRDGITLIPGNHDYYSGVGTVLDAAARAGATVLRNRGQIIGSAREGFALLGLDDRWGARLVGDAPPDLEQALSTVPADLPRVLLWHNPDHFADAAGKVALQLSGHTHGGQLNLGIRPAELFLPHPWIAGSYELQGSRLYVNRGFGTAGPPSRIGAPPEVTKIVLVSA